MPGSSLSNEDSPLRRACMATSLDEIVRECAAFPQRSIILVVPSSSHVRAVTAAWMRILGAGLPPRVFTMTNLMRRLAAVHLPDISVLTASDVSILFRQAAIASRASASGLGVQAREVLEWKSNGVTPDELRSMADEERPLPRRTERVLDAWDTYERWKGDEWADHVDVATGLAQALQGRDASMPFTLPGDTTVIQGVVVSCVHSLCVAERQLLKALALHTHVGIQWQRAPEDAVERTRNLEQISELMLDGWSYEYVPKQRVAPLRQIVHGAHNRRAEVRTTLRFAKKSILDGSLTLDDICIAMPGVSDYDAIVREMALEVGIPLATKERMRLAHSGVSSAVVAALDMMSYGWRRADVERLLRSGYVMFTQGITQSALVHMAARLRIHGGEGHETWLRKIDQRRASIASMDERERNDRDIATEVSALHAARQTVEWLCARCPTLQGDHTAASFASIVRENVISALGIEDVAMSRSRMADERSFLSSDRQSVDAINDALLRYERMTTVAGAPPRTFTEHVNEFRRLLREATVNIDDVRLQGVTVATTAEMVRGRSWKLVAMLGCVEGEFPRLLRESDDGLPPDESFYEASEDLFDIQTSIADSPDALFLATFPLTVDEADTVPSQFIDGMESTVEEGESRLADHVVLSAKERMLLTSTATHDFERRQMGDVIEHLPEDSMQKLRQTIEPYMSPSRLDLVASCPYKFFARYALQLPQQEDESESLSGSDRGSLLHAVVRTFYDELQALPSGATLVERLQHAVDPTAYDVSDLENRLLNCFERIVKRYDVDHVYTEVERRAFVGTETATGLLVRWLRFELEFMKLHGLRPALFEYEVDTDVVLGETPIHVQGRIDRIDVQHDGENVVFNIVDYKSTKSKVPSNPSIVSGEHSQMLLYTLAVQAQWRAEGIDAIPNLAVYQTFGKRLAMRERDEVLQRQFTRDVVLQAEQHAEEFVAIARSGKYAVRPTTSACTYCSYSEVCRKDHWGTVS